MNQISENVNENLKFENSFGITGTNFRISIYYEFFWTLFVIEEHIFQFENFFQNSETMNMFLNKNSFWNCEHFLRPRTFFETQNIFWNYEQNLKIRTFFRNQKKSEIVNKIWRRDFLNPWNVFETWRYFENYNIFSNHCTFSEILNKCWKSEHFKIPEHFLKDEQFFQILNMRTFF